MKKITFAIAAMAMFAFAACTNSTDSTAVDSVEAKRIADSIEAAKTPAPVQMDTTKTDTGKVEAPKKAEEAHK